jgi:hypothetical protein
MRLFLFIALLILAPMLASIYGFIHDQITFSISEEFFTKFRFLDYDLPKNWHPRAKAGFIGIMNAWKVGIPFGIILTTIGRIHKKDLDFLNYTFLAYMTTFLMSFIFTMIAIYMPEPTEDAITLPADITDKIAFARVVTINNFGYVGGIIGMLCGIGLHMFFYKRNLKKASITKP